MSVVSREKELVTIVKALKKRVRGVLGQRAFVVDEIAFQCSRATGPLRRRQASASVVVASRSACRAGAAPGRSALSAAASRSCVPSLSVRQTVETRKKFPRNNNNSRWQKRQTREYFTQLPNKVSSTLNHCRNFISSSVTIPICHYHFQSFLFITRKNVNYMYLFLDHQLYSDIS